MNALTKTEPQQEVFPAHEYWHVRIETIYGRLSLHPATGTQSLPARTFAFLRAETQRIFPDLKNWVFRDGLETSRKGPVIPIETRPLIANDVDLANAFQRIQTYRATGDERVANLGFNFILQVHEM